MSGSIGMLKVIPQVFGLFVLGAQLLWPLQSLAADLQTIVRRGQLIVGVKDNLRPLGFRDAEGKLQGLEIEIAQRLAEEILGRQSVTFKAVNNRDRLMLVTEGQVDLTIARVTATSSRSRIVAFSAPYYLDGTALVTKNSGIQKVSDLNGQTIAVLNDSSTIASLRYRLPQIKLVGVDSYQAGQELLETGGAIAFAADASVLTGWVQEFSQFRLLPLRLSTEPLCIVLPKGVQYDELRRRIDSAIARWHSEGWLEKRAAYWGLP
ncbi:transporter substrate-binding domain-containing protein [Phormidesmis sp. 146-35]